MHWFLIHKYLSKQCSEADETKVEQWIEKNPKHQKFMESVQKIWEVAPKEEAKVDVEAAWRQFRADRMDLSKVHPLAEAQKPYDFKDRRSKSRSEWNKRKLAIMAAAAITLLVAVVFVIQTQLKKSTPVTYQKIVTNRGETAQIILEDGSKVKLNATSMLKIPSNYGKSTRTVYLKGEGFFTVKHNFGRPFVVHTEGLIIKDLGTKFNIKSYSKDETAKVVVVEGKVKLGSINAKEEKSTYLTAYERAVVSKDGKISIKKVKVMSRYIGWIKGKLVFEKTPFSKVIKRLERWYGVECEVSDSKLLKQHLTATFINQPLANVLLLISKAMNIKVEREKTHITFIAKENDQY